MKKILLIGGVLVLVVLVAVGYYRYAPRRVPAGQPPLAALTSENFPDFQRQFNDAADRVRVVTLLSPT